MDDPRVTPTNGRVAHASVKDTVEAERYSEGRWMMVQQPIANLTDTPRGSRGSQLLFGERFLVLDTEDGFAFGQSERDGYVGYIVSGALTGAQDATHWVLSNATHLYPRPE